jgi:tRNA(Ile)-lysidine synthase
MLARAVARAVEALDLRGRRLLVACSAGVDSTTLLDVLHRLPPRLGLSLAVGHVNHGLRGEDSEADEAFVRGLGEARGLPVHVTRADPRALRGGGPSRSRPTLQEAARAVRYEALARMAGEAGAERVVTAHTADDQAETVLLRLLRGTGPDGLAGIPEVSHDGLVARPLLRVSRAEIEAHAGAAGLAWREDASNARPDYARNRVRRRLRELAAEFNPRLLRAIADLAEAQRREGDWIGALVEQEAAVRFAVRDGALVIAAEGWGALPAALERRLVRTALHRAGAGRDVSRAHLERVRGFLRRGRRGGRLELPGGRVLVREGPEFVLHATLPESPSRKAPEVLR